ncbi:gliding motility-associated C-terminal domain-containing protein [Mucilaginibacter sp. AK015]|uniref:gliding motility-associated C-terminal domain-containing protein n=1 Tax=Mucilaginibacter sp. AK015 TaxID=2723072 RepID=UPI001614B31F|nr:gliding motility-associated C-terminal domain-containing protein [Mucilaginibacter sp. AK015]MBB5396591.1 gliding motility-associated-like protein [Mucilaginibacter sp. AK015]
MLTLLLGSTHGWAQVCTGSLGDPVFTFDFGSGNEMKFPTTGYSFRGGSCPDDGQYSISKTETGCHDDTWHKVLKDHTGNDGYMMVINADAVAGKEFFSKETTIEGTNLGALCENTTYEFSAYILNLIKAGQFGFIEPKITFIIQTTTGEIIKQSDPTDIPPTGNPDGWEKYGVYFTTPPGVTTVVVKMVNNAPGGAGNDFLLDDIAFRACGPVIKAGIAGDVSVTQTNLCAGNPKTYTIKAEQPAGYANAKYQWQQNLNNGQGWKDMAGEESLSLTLDFPAGKPVGTYQYRLGVAEGGNIQSLNCRVYSNTVTIDITAYPDPPQLLPLNVCEGDPFTLTAAGGATYKWTGPNLPETSENPLVFANAGAGMQGRYTVEVISAAGCSTFRYVDVTVNQKPVIQLSNANPAVCSGDGVTISAFATDAKTYSWFPVSGLSNPNIANPVASPDVSTQYTVTVTANNGCVSTRTVLVTVKDRPVANAGEDKKIFEGQSVTLEGKASGSVLNYTWSPPDFLDDPHSLTPVATPPVNKTYTLTVTSDNDCGIAESSVFIRVYNKLVLPSAFTPNNDGVNDIWNIEALQTYPESIITIYTRDGKQVFRSKGYSKPWDGKFNGSPLPAGTYYYVIDLKNDTPTRSGWVMLMR